jgi:hypothetical protein
VSPALDQLQRIRSGKLNFTTIIGYLYTTLQVHMSTTAVTLNSKPTKLRKVRCHKRFLEINTAIGTTNIFDRVCFGPPESSTYGGMFK